MIDYYETKQHPITRKMVLEAYKHVRSNKGAAGVDGQTLEEFAKVAPRELYKIWNRMTSGCYYPSDVREVLIPKKSGGLRMLGIPTVSDRIAQQVVKAYLEPIVEPTFHENSYGYRPGRNAHQALEKVSKACKYYNWILDIDIRKFFDSIDHELMMKALQWYTKEKWVLMYVERWLKAGIFRSGKSESRDQGTPQGGVISALLANIYLHVAMDKWMEKNHPYLHFVRYCDDAVIHCSSEKQARFIKDVLAKRLKACKLALNEEKTVIAYCRNQIHKESHRKVCITFLGYTFRPVLSPTRNGWILFYTPCMSAGAKKEIRAKVRAVIRERFVGTIQELAAQLNSKIRGWIRYYCAFSAKTTYGLWYWMNQRLVEWVRKLRGFSKHRAYRWMKRVYANAPGLFAHWQLCHP